MLKTEDSEARRVFVPRATSVLEAAGLQRPDSRTAKARPEGMLFLDKNENPDPLLRDWYQSLLPDASALALGTYPDLGELYASLAKWLGIPVGHLALTTGCDGAIRQTFEIFISPGDKVAITQPTFAMYPVYASAFGAQTVSLHYARSVKGPALTVDTIVEAVRRERPRLLCIPNPDSPTGNTLDLEELRVIADACVETQTVFLVDEAYFPFSEVTAVPLATCYPNVIVARNFSKAWGLAGLRTGYVIGCPETIEWYHRTRPMYEIGAFPAHFLTVVLRSPQRMDESVRRLNDGRDEFAAAMTKMGFAVLPSGGNFLHVDFGNAADAVHAALSPFVLYRANTNEECLRGYSRFSAAPTDMFEPIVAAIAAAQLNR